MFHQSLSFLVRHARTLLGLQRTLPLVLAMIHAGTDLLDFARFDEAELVRERLVSCHRYTLLMLMSLFFCCPSIWTSSLFSWSSVMGRGTLPVWAIWTSSSSSCWPKSGRTILMFASLCLASGVRSLRISACFWASASAAAARCCSAALLLPCLKLCHSLGLEPLKLLVPRHRRLRLVCL